MPETDLMAIMLTLSCHKHTDRHTLDYKVMFWETRSCEMKNLGIKLILLSSVWVVTNCSQNHCFLYSIKKDLVSSSYIQDGIEFLRFLCLLKNTVLELDYMDGSISWHHKRILGHRDCFGRKLSWWFTSLLFIYSASAASPLTLVVSCSLPPSFLPFSLCSQGDLMFTHDCLCILIDRISQEEQERKSCSSSEATQTAHIFSTQRYPKTLSFFLRWIRGVRSPSKVPMETIQRQLQLSLKVLLDFALLVSFKQGKRKVFFLSMRDDDESKGKLLLLSIKSTQQQEYTTTHIVWQRERRQRRRKVRWTASRTSTSCWSTSRVGYGYKCSTKT